jgi:diguanylate cyclase (GGDEF)-like protein/PAS domain S-box-containing protein
MRVRNGTLGRKGVTAEGPPIDMTTESQSDLPAQIVELIGDPIAIAAPRDADHAAPTIVHANAGFARLIGRHAEAIMGQSLQAVGSTVIEPSDLARIIDAIEQQRAIDLALQIAAAGGRTLWTQLQGRPLAGQHRSYMIHLRDVTTQRTVVATAQRLERRFDALANLTSDGVYHLRVDPDCRLILDWTAGAFERLTGYSVAELEALGGWLALVEPADVRLVQRRAQKLLSGERASAEYRIRSRDGALRWVRDTGWPQWDEARELVVGILCAAQDITEHRALEEKLLVHQLERRSLLSLTDGLICEIDGEGCLRTVSGDGESELAGRLRAGVGRSLAEVIGPEPAALWQQQIARIAPGWAPVSLPFAYSGASGEEQHEIRLCAASGGMALALIQPQTALTDRDDLGPIPGRPDPRLRALLELQSSAAILLASGLTILELNDQAEQLTGWQRANAIGRPFVELMALAREQPALLQDLERAQSGIRVNASEAWLRLPDGQEGRLVWNYIPLLGADDQVYGVLAQADPFAPLSDAGAARGADRLDLKALMHHVAEGIITLDARGVIVSFSPSAETIFDYRREEIVGRNVDVLVVRGSRDRNALKRIMAVVKLPGKTREMMARRKSGEVVAIDLSASEVLFNGTVMYILTIRDITVRKHIEETIRNLAYHDPLTGLPNRLLFNDRLSQAIERARRHRQLLAVMILDLDRFKLINDSLGLASGDEALRAVGERLVATVRRSDTVARLGGDDFLLLLPGVDGAESSAKVAQKILDTFVPPLQLDDQELHLGATLGITLYPHDGDDAETLIRNADTALYRAKEHSRGSYQFYTTDMNATAFERLVLETQLRKALERGELVLHYQPQVRLDSGAVVAVEALVRWFHADLGLISPAEFIPLAEETGLILDLGRWVLSTACTQVRSWQEQGFADLRLAVNLSSRQFEQDDLVRSIAQVIEEATFDPGDLDLELTESSIMRSPEQAVAKLQALDRLGIRLSIDDFGTGYSSLGHLKRFPIRTLKIDQSFIQDITTDPNDAAIAQAIIALAESLQLKVIAEGVETRDQLDLLRRYHCDEMQGYLFARPLPPGELLKLLQSGSRLTH